MDNWQDLQNNDINQFISNYRDTLEQQRDLAQQNLQQQRENDFASIMSNANTRGMLYSNFPARDKVKYDTNTYQPNLVKTQQSYQTGLDKLRSNALKVWNTNKSIQEKIDDLAELDAIEASGLNNLGNTTTTNNDTLVGDKTAKYTQNGSDYTFTDANGNPITFYEYAANHNQLDDNTIKGALKNMQTAGNTNAERALSALNKTDNVITSDEKAALEALGIPATNFVVK